MVKPSPKNIQKPTFGEGIKLPTTTTVIPPIPIKSPSASRKHQSKKSDEFSDDYMKNIMSIDVTKLKAGRAIKGTESGYNVNEFKALAGGLNLTKTGNKKELVERIKQAILNVNPTAFD